jgi:hydroxymethylpyrimidine/phosphomethylpyrimidine kinase
VYQTQPIEPEWLEAQWAALETDIAIQSCKVGVLGSVAVAQWLASKEALTDLILDPVLAAGGGAALSDDSLTRVLCHQLLPRTRLLTPNLPEVQSLSGQKKVADCAQVLCDQGCTWVLITGGHDTGDEVINRLFDAGGLVADWAWPRLPHPYHGSGCTLASACAALLAKGLALPQAVEEAQAFTWQTLLNARQIGQHQAFPNRRPTQ